MEGMKWEKGQYVTRHVNAMSTPQGVTHNMDWSLKPAWHPNMEIMKGLPDGRN